MDSIISPENLKGVVKAFFTTKALGAEREKICSMVSLEQKHLYMPVQKHTDKITVLESDALPEVADAVISDRRGILLGVRVADCVPALLFDRRKSVIGAVHAGWRGTAAHIVGKTIALMTTYFGSAHDDILLALGPSIRGCCYRVDGEVLEAVVKATGDGEYFREEGKKYLVDLSYANRIQALSEGIPAGNIWMSSECTCCNPERYYSYRFRKDYGGSQGGFIGML